MTKAAKELNKSIHPVLRPKSTFYVSISFELGNNDGTITVRAIFCRISGLLALLNSSIVLKFLIMPSALQESFPTLPTAMSTHLLNRKGGCPYSSAINALP